MSKLITPTVGRVVWYWPSQQEIDARALAIYDQAQPMAATVAYVCDDRMVNLSVVDHSGFQFRRTSVKLLQEDDARPHTSEGPFAEWMPYQKNAALKDDLQKLETAALSAAVEVVAMGIDPAAPGADQTVETKVYTDGTSATGTPPLPELSPAQQEAAANGAGDADPNPAQG